MSTVIAPAARPLKASEARLIEKLKTLGLVIPADPVSVRTNPFSGRSVALEPLAAGLYDWIVSPQRGDNINAGVETRSPWDRARMLFASLWGDAYYDLID